MNNSIKSFENLVNNKNILVTGGTGSIGLGIVKNLLKYSPNKIVIFSRDELKQHNIKNDLSKYRNIKLRIGDIRDYQSLVDVTRGIDLVYHVAAMKHVSICEENPIEAVKTNILGAYNLKEACIINNVPRVIAISTDKAVKSVNVMGMTKAIQERILLHNNENNKTKFICVRFGNVINTRGSVIPSFFDRIKNNKPLLLTNENMTRFLMSLEDALELVFKASVIGNNGEIYVKKMPVCKIIDLARTLSTEITGKKNYPIKISSIRQGEQIYESLVSEEEMRRVKETEEYYVIYPYKEIKKPILKRKISEYRTDQVKKYMGYKEIKDQLIKSEVI